METKKTIGTVLMLQHGIELQNNSIKTAILALKEITHSPIFGADLKSEETSIGITLDDKKLVSDFIKFLEKKEIGLREMKVYFEEYFNVR